MSYNLLQFDNLDSTNKKAKEMAAHGAVPWTVVAAGRQGAGYGRKGDGWYSPEGGLYFSAVLPKSNIDDLQTLTTMAAAIVAKTIKENFGIEPFIKLPNDVYVNGKKVCGILTENVVGNDVKLSVIGIGLNTNIEKFPPALEKTATSLKMELKRDIDNKAVLEQIVLELQKLLESIKQ